jgi:hypothetical protein
MSAVFFWLAKPLAEFLLAVGVSLAVVVVAMLVSLPAIRRQARCAHDGSVSETSACDAICNQCGKNLGFIGTWRAKRATKET